MRTSQIHKRLDNLAAKICPTGIREFTLEELCRHYWHLNKRAFLAFVRESPEFHVFATIFQQEDADRSARLKRQARTNSSARLHRA